MGLQTEQEVDLTNYTTLGVPSVAASLVRITDVGQLATVRAEMTEGGRPPFVLGGGSNIVVGVERFERLVLKIELTGRAVVEQTEHHTDISVAAGENWDELVAWTVEQGLGGIEALSLIPGTVGAAPVQNVGAYGQEVSQTILTVGTFNMKTGKHKVFTPEECGFSYRRSMFQATDDYVITDVTFRLTPAAHAKPPKYASLQAELDRRGITGPPTLQQTRDAVIAIRQSKLPDPAKIPTAGSFFRNPIICMEHYEGLAAKHPDIPHYPVGGNIKIPAAWLVEQCGWRGVIENGIGMFDKQAVSLVNPGRRPATEVLAFRDKVAASVKDRFGIELQMEPELVG